MKPGCSVEGCDRDRYCKGLCRPHYDRPRRRKGAVRQPTRPCLCSVRGCHDRHHAFGLCKIHYTRKRYARERQIRRPDEPRVSVAPLLPVLERLAQNGKAHNANFNDRQEVVSNDTLSALAQRVADITSLSARDWRRRFTRYRSGDSETILIGDADAICCALNTHLIFFYPEEYAA